MFKRIVLAVLFLGAVCFADDWKREYRVGASPYLQVETNDASIEVHGTNGASISVNVTAKGYSIGPDGVRVSERQDGDQVYVQVKIPHWNFWFNFTDRSVHIEVWAPQQTKIKLDSSDGSLRLDGTRGEARLNTSDGSIRVNNFDGVLVARSADGSIEATGRFDGLDLNTSDGHVTAEVRAGSHLSSNWSIRTADGSITLRLPEDLAVDLDAWTSDGSVSVDLPMLVQGTQGRNRVHGRLNGGGPLLEVRTSDGSVHISR